MKTLLLSLLGSAVVMLLAVLFVYLFLGAGESQRNGERCRAAGGTWLSEQRVCLSPDAVIEP